MGRVMFTVDLIPQCADQTCWYACLQMMVRYRRLGGDPSIGGGVDLAATTAEVCQLNRGINLSVAGAVETIAGWANARIHRVRSTLDGIERLLTAHGPLFYAGISTGGYRGISGGHAVVITGIDGSEVLINDPAPTGVGLQASMDSTTLFATLVRNPAIPLLSV